MSVGHTPVCSNKGKHKMINTHLRIQNIIQSNYNSQHISNLLYLNINNSPFEDGWMFKVENINTDELDNLMNSDEYDQLIKE